MVAEVEFLVRGVFHWLVTTGLRIIVILAVAGVTWYAVHSWLHRFVMRVPFDSDERRERAGTLARSAQTVLTVIIVAAATLSIMTALDVPVGPLLASAGLTGLAVAVGSQALVRDFVAGVFILIEGQLAIGDQVRAAAVSGTVERITPRAVWLRDESGLVHVVPNSAIVVMTNLSRHWSRAVLKLTFPRDQEVAQIRRALEAMADRVGQEHGLFGGFVEPPVVVGPVDLAGATVSYELTVKVKPNQLHTAERRLRLAALQVLQDTGVRLA